MSISSYINPELVKSFRTSLSPRKTIFVTLLALSLACVIAGISWVSSAPPIPDYDYRQLERAGKDAFFAYTIVLVALLFIIGPAMSAISLIQERLRGTAIFQQMVLISPFELAMGKLLGSSLLVYFAALVFSPFFILSAGLADIGPNQLFRIGIFFVFGGIFCQAVGLLVSAMVSASGDKFVRGGLLVGPIVGGFGLITCVATQSFFFTPDPYYTSHTLHFFGQFVPGASALTVLFIVGALWAFSLTIRQIKAGQLIELSPWPVWLLFLTAELILVGICWGYEVTRDNFWSQGMLPLSRLFLYLIANWVALLVMAGSYSLSADRLREWWGARQDAHAIFYRKGVRNDVKTILVSLCITSIGLVSVWYSLHSYPSDPLLVPDYFDGLILASLAACFIFTIIATVAFVQFCAMFKLRLGAWTGVVLTVALYSVLGIGGALLRSPANPVLLTNPLLYAQLVTAGDPNLHPEWNKETGTLVLRQEPLARDGAFGDEEPATMTIPNIMLRAIIVEGLLALFLVGLAWVKWTRLREGMMGEKG
jgi:hypothetical protein